jgi:hypothetical protein
LLVEVDGLRAHRPITLPRLLDQSTEVLENDMSERAQIWLVPRELPHRAFAASRCECRGSGRRRCACGLLAQSTS